MTLHRAKLSLVHVAKRRLRLDDEAWRAMLARVAGVESSKDLDEAGFAAVMQVLEAAGFKSDFGAANFGNLRHFDMATAPQVALIRDLWSELHDGELDEAHLDRWLSRFGVSSLRFLTREKARKVIAALKSWKARKIAKPAAGDAA